MSSRVGSNLEDISRCYSSGFFCIPIYILSYSSSWSFKKRNKLYIARFFVSFSYL
uniref:Uncharacterized protein n=1 Tax=Heterorhabditis bacteriophora TaxID=37862 RepID=A0A1I7XA70_HETBA